MGVLLGRQLCQVGIEIGIKSSLGELCLCEVGKTLPIKGILELFKTQDKIEKVGFFVLRGSWKDWKAAMGD